MKKQLKVTASLAGTIKTARKSCGFTLRELSRRSGISAAQLSRIEAGVVERPEMDTLLQIAQALSKEPQMLLIVAGHLVGERARAALRDLVTFKSGLWNFSEEETGRLLDESVIQEAPDEQLPSIAATLFVASIPTHDISGDYWLEHVFGGDVSDDLREVIVAWRTLSERRQQKALDYVREQATLTRLEADEGTPDDA